MPGHRIYYVPPRLVGSIADWSGKDAPDGQSWLLEQAKSMNFNAVWFSPMFETTKRATVDAEGRPATHSLYATRSHKSLDAEFSATPGDRDSMTQKERDEADKLDREHIEYFTQQAKAQGLKVFGLAMADLVFNHLASDHPAVLEENKAVEDFLKEAKTQGKHVTPLYAQLPNGNIGQVIGMVAVNPDDASQEYARMYFKFSREEKNFEVLNIGMTKGYDTAQLNYDSPAAKEFFVTGTGGEDGYWKQVIDWCIDRGLSDFRCDIAYRLPPDWWQELIEHAMKRNPDVVFMAETLGGPDADIERMAKVRVTDKNGKERPGFELGMISNYWWNYTDDWLPRQEIPRLRRMAKYGGAASPDNHDTAETLAGHFQRVLKDHEQKARDTAVANIGVRDYAISAFIGNSVYMQMGFEYSKEKQNGVFAGQVSPQDWKDITAARPDGHALNISKRIKAINDLKESLGVENAVVEIKEHCNAQSDKLVKMSLEYTDADTGAKLADVVLVINKNPENGPVPVTDGALTGIGSGGLVLEGAKDAAIPPVSDVLIYHTPVPPKADVKPQPKKGSGPSFPKAA